MTIEIRWVRDERWTVEGETWLAVVGRELGRDTYYWSFSCDEEDQELSRGYPVMQQAMRKAEERVLQYVGEQR